MVPMTSAIWPTLRQRLDIPARSASLSLALGALLAATLILWPPAEAHAFCGFYVGRAGAQLYNHASQVVMVRDGDRTVLSLMNDYQGEPEQFALVIPVPTVPNRARSISAIANCSSISTATARRAWSSTTTRTRVRCRCRRCSGA